MGRIKTIVFDLDGTLLDTSKDITSAVNRVRRHYGLPPLTVHEVIKYIGLGVTHLMEKSVAGERDVPLDEARLKIIEYYSSHLLDETTVYPGILPLLQALCGDYNLAVATNKPSILASNSIRGLGLDKYFGIIAGPETVNAAKPAPDMLIHIGKKFETSPEETILVGDSLVDIETARNYGCRICAAAWGYNITDILRKANPDFLIHEPLDLLEYL